MAIPWLEHLGIYVKMPALLQRGQSQLPTEEANESRLITKTRWLVEARNGHIKSIFKFFFQIINVPHIHNLGDFYRIAGAIINRYHPPIYMEGANAYLAREMLEKSQTINIVQARVEADNLRNRNGRWRKLNQHQVPRLTLDHLRDLTVGVYQVNLAPSYIQDKIQRDGQEEFQLDEFIDEPGFIRVRLYSRFRNATKYQLWIAYDSIEDNEHNNDIHDNIIHGYYCTCKTGARSIGSCAHVASVLWYLGYARHEPNVSYPATSLLHNILDTSHRAQPINDPNGAIELGE